MKLVIASLLALSVGSALAHGCPGEMKAIDARMPAVKLDQAQMDKAREWRARGEQLHKEGKHSESMAALAEAKKILGL